MSLIYYALYMASASQPPPTGLVILDPETTDALVWDNLDEAWAYDPESAHEVVFGPENWDRVRALSREEAEAITPTVTREELPDEETIRWIFRWKGEPPGMDAE